MPIDSKGRGFFDKFFYNRSSSELIALRAIAGKDELSGSWYFPTIGELEQQIRRSVAKEEVPPNMYFGVCTHSKPGPSKNDVCTGFAAWADIDLGSTILNEKMKIIDSIIKNRLLLHPSIVVDSGNGVHLYWLLTEPTNNLDLLERTCRNLGIIVGGDEVFDRTRIMRVPGSLNTKAGPPGLLVQVIRENNIRYSLEDLFTSSCIEEKTVNRILEGNVRGFKSRSHRDWAVVRDFVRCGATDELIERIFAEYPVGDKFREDGGATYLAHTIKRARTAFEEEVTDGQEGKQTIIAESGNSWFLTKDGKKRQLSTFVFYPKMLVRSDSGDVFIGDIATAYGTEYKNVRLPHSAFSRSTGVSEAFPFMDCAWLGTDNDVKYLLPYMFSAFKEFGVVKELRSQTGFHRNCWVGSTQIIDAIIGGPISAEDALIAYDNKTQDNNIVYDFDLESLTHYDVQQFFNLLPGINRPENIAIMVGWLCASLFKSRLEPLDYRFPFLNISGTRGSGKTTLIKEVMQPLVGYVKSRTYDCSTTRFVLLSLLGSSTDIFISLSEYRRSAMSEQGERNLQRYLLLGYDSGLDPRGRPNQTIQNYEITTPLTLDGEDAVDDPALLERSIHIRMSPEDIQGSAAIAFDKLSKLPLNKIGTQLILHSLSLTDATEEILLDAEKEAR